MKVGLVAVAAVAVVGLAACGKPAAPLSLEQRVLTDADAPGFEPDPIETPRTATAVDELPPILNEHLITTTGEDPSRLQDDGFVALVVETRFRPNEAGGEHPPEDGELVPHVRSFVAQFSSETGAKDANDLFHEDGLEPCPENCAFDIREFQVDGIPNATGVLRIATQDSIEAVGDENVRPIAEYTIRFADGTFAYDITVFGAPDDVTERQAEEIVSRLYTRVHGAPLPAA